MSGYFANGNIKPEDEGRRPCTGPTAPHMLSVSFQLPSLQAEPAATALAPRVEPPGTVLWLSAGSPRIPWVLQEQSLVLGKQTWGWTLGHSGFQVGSFIRFTFLSHHLQMGIIFPPR